MRESLQLKPKDKRLYVIDGGRMIVQPVHGGISRLKGIFRDAVKGPIDFKKLREETKRIVAERVLAHHVQFMRDRGVQALYSYDTDFDTIPGIRRLEP